MRPYLRRETFQSIAVSVERAIDQANRLTEPFIMLDTGDSVPDGSPGDGTILLRALVEARLPSALVHIVDSLAVEQCIRADRNERLDLHLGGRKDWRLGDPLHTDGTVKRLVNIEQCGQTKQAALIELAAGPSVLITSEKVLSSDVCRALGDELNRFQVVVAKQAHLVIANEFGDQRRTLPVMTPGPTALDLGELVYHRRRRPMFPLEEI